MAMSEPKPAVENRYLSATEVAQVERTLLLLEDTLKGFPNVELSGRVDHWARFEEWARLARSAVYRIYDTLGPIQNRSDETRVAFLSAVGAFDHLTDIVDRKYQELTRADFDTARELTQTCLLHCQRLLRDE